MALLARLAAGVHDPWQGKLKETSGVCWGDVEMRSRLICPSPMMWFDCPVTGRCGLFNLPIDTFRSRVGIGPGVRPIGGGWLGDTVAEITRTFSQVSDTRKRVLGYPLREVGGALREERGALVEFLYALEDDSWGWMGTDELCVRECRKRLAHRMVKIDTVPDTTPVGVRLVHLFCLLSGELSERKAVTDIAHRIGISDDVFSYGGWFDRRRGWWQYEEMAPLAEGGLAHPVDDQAWFWYACNAKGTRLETIHRNPKDRTILPITAWTKETTECRYYLNLPPWKPRLYGQDKVLANKAASVFLTDATEVALANSVRPVGNDVVWASWYGEESAVGRVDWECLKGRNVFYIILEQPGCSRKSAYQTAYAVHRALAGLRGTRLTFIDVGRSDAGADGRELNPIVMSAEEFHGCARNTLDLDAPPPIRGFAPKTMRDLVDEAGTGRRFLLEPLIHEKSTTLIYAWTNVGKTWFALCMGVMVAQGGTLFGRWRARKPLRVLYVDSEMDDDSMRERLRLISRMRFDGRRVRRERLRNLTYISRKRSHADADAFKKDTIAFVATTGVSLVILDNLTAFTQHNDSAKAWEDIHVWIDCLKDKGCAVLIVHHENKQGGQRGTSATTNAVDNVIHLLPPTSKKQREGKPKRAQKLLGSGTGANRVSDVTPGQEGTKEIQERPLPDNGLRMRVEIEKGREIYGKARRPFTAEICPNARPPRCDFVAEGGDATALGEAPAKRTYRRGPQRDALMQRALSSLKNGSSVKDVARDLGVSTSYVYNISRRREDPNWKHHEEAQEARRRERDSSIFERSAREGARTIAASLRMSLTSVKRIIDAAWTRRIVEAPSFKEGKLPEEIAAELGTGTDAVKRLLHEIRLRQVPHLRGNHMTVADIAKELGVTTKRVEKRCRALEAAERKSKQRCDDMAKVARLHGERLSDSEIIRMTGLPRRTVIVERSRLDPSRRKPKRNASAVPSAPSVPPAPPPAPG